MAFSGEAGLLGSGRRVDGRDVRLGQLECLPTVGRPVTCASGSGAPAFPRAGAGRVDVLLLPRPLHPAQG